MKNRKMIMGMAVLAMSALVLAGCGTSQNNTSDGTSNTNDADNQANVGQETTEIDSVFGEFTTVTLAGESVTQELFSQAELTMVNIWGTFCGPCISEMPELGELSEEYASQGVQIVGLMSDVTEAEDETAKQIVADTGAGYTHLVLSQDLYDNYMNQVQVVPTTVFVDSEGNQVGDVYTGARDKAAWAAIIDTLLEEVK